MAQRGLGLIVGIVVTLATLQPADVAGNAPMVAPAPSGPAASSAWSVNDPHLLFVFSQMEMALGDVNSAVELADRAASMGRKETVAPQPRAIDEDCPLSKPTSGRS